jgi:hypothetical protein
MRSPVELRLAAGLLVGSALLFLLMALGRMLDEGGGGWVQLPLLQLALALGVGGGVLTGIRLARYAGIAVALVGGLVHMVLALQPAPWWARIVFGIVAIAQVYAAVLLNTKPAVEFTGGGGHGTRR